MRSMAGKVTYPGEFEQVVLLAVVHLGSDAYGASIRREIEARGGRTVTIGAAYMGSKALGAFFVLVRQE